MARVELHDITKVFPGSRGRASTVALDHVNLTVGDSEFLVLVGPSGCGKSTLLRIVAGLEEASGGTVVIDDVVVNDLSPHRRDVAMVFQSYALYPHMTVADNLRFSLRVRHHPRQEIAERVGETARVLGLELLLERKPAALSGGQRQRVAMGRSLVRQPTLLLMDEPLSNLDAKLRVAMRGELIRLHQRYHTTTLYVTHDQVEAMTLGDRIAVLDRGVLQQVGTPDELFRSPDNIFVAGFIGSPAMNLARGRLEPGPGGVHLVAGPYRAPLAAEWTKRWPGLAARVGQEIIFGLRPSAFSLATPDSAEPGIRVRAVTVESLGDERNVLFVPPFERAGIASESTDENEPDRLWTARLAPEAPVRLGDEILLVPHLSAAYFFDPDSELAIPAAFNPAGLAEPAHARG
ncbi:MAG TPA: ABC transporter ATP-binding protein [Micromonosporaceae bacterium]|jgi:multiple sugar transport system ATP-binding protein